MTARRVRSGGTIINFSTSVIKRAVPTYAAYAASMLATVDRLEAERDEIKGVIITSAKKTFFAGGDLNDLKSATKDDAEHDRQLILARQMLDGLTEDVSDRDQRETGGDQAPGDQPGWPRAALHPGGHDRRGDHRQAEGQQAGRRLPGSSPERVLEVQGDQRDD